MKNNDKVLVYLHKEVKKVLKSEGWGLFEKKPASPNSLDRIFKEAFTKPKEQFEKKTLYGWKPVEKIYNEKFEDNFIPLNGFKKKRDNFSVARSFKSVLEPEVQVYETEELIVINADIPGVVKESIFVDVQGSNISFSGEYKTFGCGGEFRRVILFQMETFTDYLKNSAPYRLP